MRTDKKARLEKLSKLAKETKQKKKAAARGQDEDDFIASDLPSDADSAKDEFAEEFSELSGAEIDQVLEEAKTVKKKAAPAAATSKPAQPSKPSKPAMQKKPSQDKTGGTFAKKEAARKEVCFPQLVYRRPY